MSAAKSEARTAFSNYYVVPFDDDDLGDIAGAGSWLGHVDRGSIAGAGAFGGTYAVTGDVCKASIAGGFAFAAGVGQSMYNGGCSGGGNSGGRVICTHFFRRGMMERDLWRADLEFTYNHLSPITVRGYQYWAIPYVRLMRRSSLAERLVYPLAKARAEEVGHLVGIREKGSLLGKLVRLIGEPICFAVGAFVSQKDWSSLWIEESKT